GGSLAFSPSALCSAGSPTPAPTYAGTSTATPTRTPSFTAVAGTPTQTPTRTASFTLTPTPSPAAACTPDYRFEGSTQGWLPDTAFDTGFSAVAASATQYYEGSQSRQVTANLTTSGASQTGAIVL